MVRVTGKGALAYSLLRFLCFSHYTIPTPSRPPLTLPLPPLLSPSLPLPPPPSPSLPLPVHPNPLPKALTRFPLARRTGGLTLPAAGTARGVCISSRPTLTLTLTLTSTLVLTLTLARTLALILAQTRSQRPVLRALGSMAPGSRGEPLMPRARRGPRAG